MSENVHPKATSVAEFEKAAKEKLPEFVQSYYSHPGEGGQTYRDNCWAFQRLPNIWLDDVTPGLPGSTEHDAYLKKILKEAATWEDVKWVKNNTRLPIVLKGILSADDARIAVDLGVSGIYVSNHGGRQQDGMPATIDVLPDIVRAVGGEAEVYLDGGVRTGTDVLKALALGARCVFIGRPALWGLACNAAEGVQRVLQILKDELSVAMARAGCAKISHIQPSLVVHQSYYGVPPMAKY